LRSCFAVPDSKIGKKLFGNGWQGSVQLPQLIELKLKSSMKQVSPPKKTAQKDTEKNFGPKNVEIGTKTNGTGIRETI
jgi:hypothetical protein